MKKWFCLVVGLVVLVSSLPFAVPASAAVGVMSFSAQPLPSNTGLKLVNGSDISDIAASADGAVLYVVNGAAAGQIYKSTDSGMTFTAVTAPAAVILQMVAVAWDSADSIAVSDGLKVWVSTNGGSLWAELPQPTGTLAGTHTITSVAVGLARSGAILGREYAVSVANNTNNNVTGGDVLVIGVTTSVWRSAGAPANTRDYLAVKFSPNLDDRSVVAVGAMSTGTGGPNIAVQVFNTANITVSSPGTLVVSTPMSALTPSTLDYAAAPTGANIVRASLALPIYYDATLARGRTCYAGIAAFSGAGGITTDNDVYRVDDTTARRLSASFPGGPIWSVSYGGTDDTGTLFMGRADTADVRYTTNPTSASPTWTTTKKLVPRQLPMQPLPAGAVSNRTVVAASPRFATNNTVYAGTSGVESGFSVSTNGGLTFNQTAIIDNQVTTNDIANFEGMAFTPDGNTIFIATRANVSGPQRWLSLWKSPTPVASSTWTRLYVVASAGGANGRAAVSLTPDYASTNCVYFFDKALNSSIYRSTDGGDIFAQRLGPGGVSISNDVQEDANVMYVSDGGPPPAQGVNVYKSTTGGWTWENPTAPGVGSIRSLVVPKPGALLVGGVGYIAYSTDGGLTYTKYSGANATESYRIAKHSDFAKNSTVFLGDAAAVTGAVYRYAIGTDPAPVDLIMAGPVLPLAVQVGFGLRGGVLYVPYLTGIARTLYPMEPAGQQQWRLLNQPAASFPQADLALGVTAPANTLYVSNSTTRLSASHDYLAVAKPRITSPADNTTVPVDPANGRASLVTVSLEPMGTGQGVVAAYEGQITEKAAGWAAGILSAGIIVTQPTSPTIMIGQTAPGPGSGGWGFVMNANTEYQVRFRAFGQLSGEDATSAWSDPITLIVSAAQQPTVTTSDATAVTGSSAVLNGFLNDPGESLNVSVSFQWGLTTQYGNMTVPVSVNATGPFSCNLTGLSPNTTYHFRARALGNGLAFGADKTFTTLALPPVVTTGSATNLTANSAALNGTVTSLGSSSNVTVSLQWGLSTAYDNATAPIVMGAPGPISVTVTGLSPSTTYHFRTKAVGDGTAYGADRTFVTPLSASAVSVVRHLPGLVSRGQTFAVNVNFTVPSDNLSSAGFTDFAPAGWTVAVNRLVCTPPADADNSAGNRVEYLWYNSTYPGGTAFTVSYNVTVPATAAPGRYSFTDGFLEYNNGTGAGPFIATVSGDFQVEVPTVEGLTYGANGVVVTGVTITMDSSVSSVSDASGVYRIGAAAPGPHTLVASKTGYRSQTQTVNVTDIGATYIADFKGATGLVPNAPDVSYVLACINKWKFPPEGLGLSLSKVLAVVNAWKFPL